MKNVLVLISLVLLACSCKRRYEQTIIVETHRGIDTFYEWSTDDILKDFQVGDPFPYLEKDTVLWWAVPRRDSIKGNYFIGTVLDIR